MKLHFNRGLLSGIKVLVIILLLNYVFIYGYTGTLAAVGTFNPADADNGSSGDWAEADTSGINGSISPDNDVEPEPTSKPPLVVEIPADDKPSAPNGTGSDKPGNGESGSIGTSDGLDDHDPSAPSDAGEGSGDNVPAGPDNPSGQEDSQPDEQASEAMAYTQADLDKVYRHSDIKTVYLTFDDGPIPSLTSAILDILAQEEVKATFFVIGTNAERYPDMIRREYEEGHGIGNHTYSHVFNQIYSSVESYLADLDLNRQVLENILGTDKKFILTRFPGGSFGEKLAPYREAVNQSGYLYVDWNSLNGDAETRNKRTAEELIQRFKETANGQSSLVVLMHDAPNKQTTIEALPEIIRYLKEQGYEFKLLPGAR